MRETPEQAHRLAISDYLPIGAENPKTGKALSAETGLSIRVITKAIEMERRNGSPICATSDSTNPGFYLAANKADMQDYCKRLNHRAGELQKTRRACLATIQQLPEN